MQLTLNPRSVDDYRRYLHIKQLPAWQIRGRLATFPDVYAERLGLAAPVDAATGYAPEPFLFDYQRDICRMAIERRKFAVFADCGLGKSLILLSYARYVQHKVGPGRRVLILTPPLVVRQLAAEAAKFWGDELPVEVVKAANLAEWLNGSGGAVGITNYEALKDDTPRGNLACLILDESSILKNHYGNYAGICLRLGEQLDWKLALTGTPAPNDRIEYANHAVFLDRFPTVNSFLATYFVNRGETQNRWEIKPHALRPFYRSLSDWCIFLSDPSVYGWRDNCDTIPPIHCHIHDVPLTAEQKAWVQRELGTLLAVNTGGITLRSAYGQVAKGEHKGHQFATLKYEFCRDLIDGWRDDESTLAWCLYDHEQEKLHAAIGGESMDGKTPMATRLKMIDAFKAGESRVLISKPRILGFGLNLQVATRQVFSGLQDSYESYYQCVKRSNRIGSTKPLNVHIPVTELELPMVENVLRKASRVESDTREQEELFAASR
jgi:superfamily II DNA or RNA helicase